ETESARWAVGRIQLVDADLRSMRIAGHVDQQVAENAIDEPRHRRAEIAIRHFGERELELVQRIEARFVDARRLTRRTDEQSRKEIRQHGMVLPVRDQAL